MRQEAHIHQDTHDEGSTADVPTIRLLVVEDSPSDMELVSSMFSSSPNGKFDIQHADRLSTAMTTLESGEFDAILLDLGLPDSQGINTFVQLHQHAPDVPILVLTSLEDDASGEKAMRKGAEDFLTKRQMQSDMLKNSVKFAVVRSNVRHQREEQKQRDDQIREMEDIHRLSTPATTSITARIYSGSPLREKAPAEFRAAIAEYLDLLNLALEHRIFKTEDSNYTDRLRELGTQIGFLRGSPRDVIEIHTSALKKRIEDMATSKAQAILEESRITLIELMGHLTSYYRSFYTTSSPRDKKS